MAAVSSHSAALEFASVDLKKDKEIVLAAVSNHGAALEFASVDLKKDKEIVLAAVSNHGAALEFASVEDKEIVLAAVKKVPDNIRFVGDNTLLDDIDIASAVLLKDPHLKYYFSESVRSNSEIKKALPLRVPRYINDDYFLFFFFLFFPYLLFAIYFIRYFLEFRSSKFKFYSSTFQKLFETFLITLFIAFINFTLFYLSLFIWDPTISAFFYLNLLLILLVCELPIMFNSFFIYRYIDFRKALTCILKSIFIPFFIIFCAILFFDPGFFVWLLTGI